MTPRAYYNEHDPFAAAWLRELIADGQIMAGDVDERSIEDVHPRDVMGYTRCHWFAGIAGWDYALRLAGWPDDEPIWTGSAPCQPFSAAGQGGGFADERHLWPAFFWLITQCQPRTCVGEQVASGDALRWWDLVATDLEGAGYACAAVDLPAASVAAPHKRSRLFWMADASGKRRDGQPIQLLERGPRQASIEVAGGGAVDGMADTSGQGSPEQRRRWHEPTGSAAPSLADPWADCIWLPCTDGKARPALAGILPLVARLPSDVVPSGDPSESYANATTEGRVGRIRGYGNAVNAQVAAAFLRACRGVIA